ncbi:hypothetical protein ACFRKE_36440 [Kitasatospora indigofera]|uniref:hypothetical protein n=1 Tax=Kitasatospora indigofera TaxID=67307 RepID=UPI003638636B
MQHNDGNERAIPTVPGPRPTTENRRPGGTPKPAPPKPPTGPGRIPGQSDRDSRDS